MLCQTKSNVWQLKLNMMSETNVRKLWFGLEAVVQLKLFIVVILFSSLSLGWLGDALLVFCAVRQ